MSALMVHPLKSDMLLQDPKQAAIHLAKAASRKPSSLKTLLRKELCGNLDIPSGLLNGVLQIKLVHIDSAIFGSSEGEAALS